MALSDKEKRRLIAITKELRRKKGIRIKKSNLDQDLQNLKKAQEKIDKIKQENAEIPAVIDEANKSHQKLQVIVDQINDYMKVLTPEGLIDIDDGGKPSGALASG